jgi:nicotinamide-nucleotide amidase
VKVSLVAVGSELLRTGFRETHSFWLTQRLEAEGFEVVSRQVVSDEEEEILRALEHARSRAFLVIATGGIGPTRDDRTREALAAAVGRRLRLHPRAETQVKSWCRRHRFPFTKSQRRQALFPEGALVLPNRVGSAPGIWFRDPQGIVLVLPGVFSELTAMFQPLAARLRSLPRSFPATAIFRSAGVGESRVDARIRATVRRFPRVEVTTLASPGEVTIQLRSRGPSAAAEVKRCRHRVAGVLGVDLVSERDETLEQVLLNLLRHRGWRLATAESCTAGLVAARLARVPGSSSVFPGGVVCYNDRAKERLLRVPRETLARWGAVSRPTALAMARGAARSLGAEVGVAVTGIAGPGGGTPLKPVGTVHWAVVHPGGRSALSRRLSGDREKIRAHAACLALDLVRRALLEKRSGAVRRS